MRFLRIEICGGIASGKTTLATLCQNNHFTAIFEDFHGNPFWKQFYTDPARFSFETEVTFLLQHYNQIKVAHDKGAVFVFDYSPLMDFAYADVNLAGGKKQAFLSVYEEVVKELSPPALLIHLTCGHEEELRRIRQRNRGEERSIQTDYLSALNQAIDHGVSEIKESVEVLEIDSEAMDFADDEKIQETIIQDIREKLPDTTARDS